VEVDLRGYATLLGPVKFVLSASGHMAGVISAPGGKYGHWTNDALPATVEEWFAGAQPA
jgi:polyhydroxyalkanoate synthase